MPASAPRHPARRSDVDEMEDMIDLNVTALTRLTYAAAPRLAERGEGRDHQHHRLDRRDRARDSCNGVYGAGHQGVVLSAPPSRCSTSWPTRALRVQAVLPGATATEFWGMAGVGSHENSAPATG